MDIILYLSNGYPTIKDSIKMAHYYAESGCKMIEVDFPAKDPYLESTMIADRMAQALEACGDYDEYMKEIETIHSELPDEKLIMLAYQDTVEEIGVEKFAAFCVKNGFQDLILAGKTTPEVRERLMALGIKVACYIQFQMLEEEIEAAKASNGFVYMQAKPLPGQGFTNEKYPTLKDCISHLREIGIDRPIYCGVGVHTPDDVRMVKEAGGDAAFVGSAILKLQEDVPVMKAKIEEFAAYC